MGSERLNSSLEGVEHNEKASACLQRYLELESKFENPPEVQLELLTHTRDGVSVDARSVAITTAYQCYSPGEPDMKKREDKRGNSVADATLAAGHHTTRMHFYATWRISGITRDATHEVIHAYPFYNTEQQSQRYVELESGGYLIPSGLTTEQREFYIYAADFANQTYAEILDDLKPFVKDRVVAVNPKKWEQEKYSDELDRRVGKFCQELARYTAPINQKTVFFHTLNEIQLLRLFRSSEMEHFSDEAKYVAAQMVASIVEEQPSFAKELEEPVDRQPRRETTGEQVSSMKAEFDEYIGDMPSRMTPLSEGQKNSLIMAIRNVSGMPSSEATDEEVLLSVLDPENNAYVADTYDIGMHDPLTAALRQLNLTYATRLSHTADSQRQRHRMTPGATPTKSLTYDGKPDYITPMVISQNPFLRQRYDSIIEKMYENVDRALELEIPKEAALSLLPNAHAIRVVESGDLFNWLHRWKQRSCLRAQEEIYFITVQQMRQFLQELPEAKYVLQAPCGVRKRSGVRPYCPEGDMFCGLPVWNWEGDLQQYESDRTY